MPDPRRGGTAGSARPSSLDPAGVAAGAGVATLLALAIVLGSQGLRHYDLGLLPYTIGVVVASFAVAYRYAVWLRRPPTRVYWRRGGQLFLRREDARRNLLFLLRSAYDNLFAQKFIQRRGRARWLAHFCLAWGCLLAGAVTFPLVFGWMHFETRADDPHWYRLVVVGTVMGEFHTQSLARYVIFNLLNVSAVMVMVGAGLALRRRLLDPGTRARQQFGNDIVPLLLLIAISATGLMLTFSMHVLHGRGYPVISLVHAFTVATTLLYLPLGKLFHAFQRPAHLTVAFYRRANEASPPAACRACGEGFAGSMHVEDLKGVLAAVGLDWHMPGPLGHYADVCPPCRRRLVGFTQGLLMGRG